MPDGELPAHGGAYSAIRDTSPVQNKLRQSSFRWGSVWRVCVSIYTPRHGASQQID